MISLTFFAVLSRNIGVGKAQPGDSEASSESFGGINVVQRPANPRDKKFVEKQCGYKIFEEFTTVVILKEQVRVTDPVMLRTLVLSNPDCEPTDFSASPWKDASLVTPRHAVHIDLAVGMKVMVTQNVQTDLDIARGEIVDIVLHPDEPPIDDGPIAHLQHVPAYILVKLTRTRATRLEGLDECVIPDLLEFDDRI